MSVRQWLPLTGLVLCVFVFNMSEFMPIGLLTSIADDFGVSESQAGYLISVYAWAVALLSLPMMLLLRRMQYRPMLLLFVGMFAFFQVLSGIATDYWMLLISRLGVAVAHAVFWSIAAPLAVRVVELRYHRAALSAIAAGTSIAMIVGLPMGRAIGLAVGWRMTFVSIAVVTSMILVLLLLVFPKLENPGTFSVRRMPDIYRNRVLMGIYVLIALFVTGYYTCYSYIEPFMLEAAGMTPEMVTLALTLFGIAGIVGSVLFSKLYGSTKYTFLFVSPLGVLVALILLDPASFSSAAVLCVCLMWGLFGTMVTISYQNELIAAAPQDAVAVAMSLFSGIFNIGIAMGAIVGGVVVDVPGVAVLGENGAVFVLASVVFAGCFLIRWIRAADRERSE